MNGRGDALLAELRELADEMGPLVAPVGHIELLDAITAAARELFEAGACSIALLDEQHQELVFHVASGAGEERVEGMRIPAHQGVAGWVLTSGQAIAIEDVRRDPRFAGDVADSTGYVPRSILAMPLETERGTLGVISVLDRRTGGGEGARDMELLSLFARQAALAVEGASVFSELGRALLRALAGAAAGGDLQAALEQAAVEASGSSTTLGQLAAHLNRLRQARPEAQEAAVRLLGEFADYVVAREQLG